MRDIQFLNSTSKELERLEKRSLEIAKVIIEKIVLLSESPKPTNSKKLVKYPYHRLRIGDYRIVYRFDDEVVQIVLIEKRDKVYQRLQKL